VDPVEEDDRLATLRRVVFYGQWFVALLYPVLLFAGRTWLGAPSGWLAGFGLVMLAPPLFLALGLPVLIVAADRRALRERIVHRPYALASLVLWVALAVFAVTLGDPDAPATALVVIWSGGRIPAAAVADVAVAAGSVAFAAWLVALGFAVGGLIEARRRRPD